MRRHTGDMFECQECEYKTIEKRKLRDHMRKHTGDMLQCPNCEYKTISKGNLKKHMRIHTSFAQRQYRNQ